MSVQGASVVVGILGASSVCTRISQRYSFSPALQGAFVEHEAALRRLNLSRSLDIVLVKTPEELERCHALIIPGGGAFNQEHIYFALIS